MKLLRVRLVTIASLVGAAGLLVNVNCGSSNGTGTGGVGGHAAGSGGHGGGTAGNGGNGGGAAGAGGTAGAASGTGGSAGAGGAAGTGGTAGATTGAGGSAGLGGHGGSPTDGGTTAAFAFYFDTGPEDFVINKAPGAGNLANVEAGTPPTLAWDGAVGDPTGGSLRIQATFTGYDQFVLTSLEVSPLIDGRGKTAQAWVMLDPVDGGTAFTGVARLEANSGVNYDGANGTYTTLTPGTWTLLTLNLATAAAPFDPAHINQISVTFWTGAVPDGGTFAGPVHASFHIDSVTDGSGGAAPAPLDHTFDTTSGGYSVSSDVVTPDGGVVPSLTWDSIVGDPAPGSLALSAEFTGYGQTVNVQSSVAPTADLTGKIIHAKVRLDSGSLPAGFAVLHASSGPGYTYAQPASSTALIAGNWLDLTLDLAAAKTANSNFDPSQIIQVGVSIGTDIGPDGGAFPTPTPLTFHIDSIVAQ